MMLICDFDHGKLVQACTVGYCSDFVCLFFSVSDLGWGVVNKVEHLLVADLFVCWITSDLGWGGCKQS